MKRLALLLSLIVLLAACVTQKKKGDVSKLKKFYHDVTAEFNGYFNANELVMYSELDLAAQHQDNFNKILPVYPALAADNPKAEASDLDNAIQKVTRVVALHPVSHWVDDCYVLAGKAQYLKQDFESAEETFKYTVAEFNPNDTSKRSKAEKAQNTAQKKKEAKKAREKKQKEREKTAKQKRKEYNKAVKQRRKDASKKGKKGKAPAKKEATTPEATTPTPETPKPEEAMAKEEEKDNKPANTPDNYFMKHRPAYQEAELWLARTYIERQKYLQAESILNRLDSDTKTFKDITADIAVARAHLYLKQKRYADAVPALDRAIELTKDKDTKARYAYILAQVYQRLNRGGDAYAAYERVLKYKPGYAMEFSARLNRTLNGYVNGQSSASQAINDLEKMLKDSKNKEYQDQVYYALAQIAFKNGDKALAIENLEKSLRTSTSNAPQKAEAYVQLADLYYEDEDYVKAKSYYDSTLLVLPNTDERFDRVSRYSTNLTDIANNINTIHLQDSLLRISRLSLDEKRALAYELKKKEDEARRQQLINQAAQGNAGVSKQPASRMQAAGVGAGAPTTAPTKSSFFAYDDKVLRRGMRDFQQKWNNRPLEDDWRRSNRESARIAEREETSGEATASTSDRLSDEQVAIALKDVPQSANQVEASNKMIADALFDLGVLYRDRLQNYDKATESLEELLRRYPDTEHKLDAYYYLYLAYTDKSNSAQAKIYYDKIIKEFPETTYARVLKDPNYLKEQGNEEKRLNDYYDRTYAYFTSGNYQQAHTQLTQVNQEFGAENKLKARFALLQAMTTGSLEGKEAYVAALQDVIGQFPDTPEEKRAREILRLLGVASNTPIRGANTETTEAITTAQFKVADAEGHYMIVALPADASLNDAKAKISDFNQQYFKLDKLRISNIYLTPDAQTPLVVIRRYKDKAEAMRYYDTVQKNAKDFLPGFTYEIFPVTQDNYKEVLRNRTLDGYREFFQKNYMK